MTDSLPVKLLRMFVAEHDEGDGPEQVTVEVADLRHVLRLLDSQTEPVEAAAAVLNPLLARYRHEVRDKHWWEAACSEARELLDAVDTDRRAYLDTEREENGGGIRPCPHCGGTTFSECLATPSCTGPTYPHVQKTNQHTEAFAHVCKRASVENGMTGVLDE